MMYPITLPIIAEQSRKLPRSGLMPVRASNGALKTRSMYPIDKHDFEIVHWLSASELETLREFYNENRTDNVTFIWPADGYNYLYTCRFADRPEEDWRPGYVIVRVSLMEV